MLKKIYEIIADINEHAGAPVTLYFTLKGGCLEVDVFFELEGVDCRYGQVIPIEGIDKVTKLDLVKMVQIQAAPVEPETIQKAPIGVTLH